MVVWRTADGTMAALDNRCAHKRFPLSEGRLMPDGSLECAYHGLCYDTKGVCVKIPSQPGQPIPPQARVATIPVLESLNDLGVRLAVDDFGTGYSSLSYLRRLPIHELQIDRSFVIDLTNDDRGEVVVRSIVDLGHALGLRVVAEGVEDERIGRLLDDLGCDLVQGFAFARPFTADRFLEWMDERRGDDHGLRQDIARPAIGS
jgi:nitrite reductase/ring-hydroxylating ferredoxin subunit